MEENYIHSYFKERDKLERLALKILNLSPGASKLQIRQAYVTMAMKYHPDKSPGNKELEKVFRNIQNAYEFLLGVKNIGRTHFDFTEEEFDDDKMTSKYNIKNDWGYFLWWRDKYISDVEKK